MISACRAASCAGSTPAPGVQPTYAQPAPGLCNPVHSGGSGGALRRWAWLVVLVACVSGVLGPLRWVGGPDLVSGGFSYKLISCRRNDFE